jgi:hypothetical protein
MHCAVKHSRPAVWRMLLAGLLLLAAVPASVWALDEVTYEAMMDKEKSKIGENVQYLITINFGMSTMVPNITAPSFSQFTVVNEYQSVQTKSEEAEHYQVLKKIWLLRPNEAGRLSIAAAIITYQDPTTNLLKNGKTQVQFLTVEPADHTPASAPAPASAAPARALSAVHLQPAFLAAAGGVALVVLLLVWLLLRRPGKRGGGAEDRALQGLDRAIRHAEQENLEAYYAALTRAFFEYLQNKFALDGDVLSTPALLAQMQSFGFGAGVLADLETFLKTADKAKFAGYVPHEDEMIVLHGIVKKFIEAGRRIKFKPAPAAKKPKRGEDED